MNLLHTVQIGFQEIVSHKFRSFLTMFGIVLGVASLISMLTTMEGMTRSYREMLTMHGGVERVSIINQDVPVGKEELKDLSPGRTMEDVAVIKENCSLVNEVSPEVQLENPSIQYLNKFARIQVSGVTEPYLRVNTSGLWQINQGRFISDMDLEENAMVCVIGEAVWSELEQSENESPVGQTIKINDQPFHVIGVVPIPETEWERKNRESGKIQTVVEREKKRRGWGSKFVGKTMLKKSTPWAYRNNQIVLIPLTTMQSLFKSASMDIGYNQKGSDPKLSSLNVTVKDPERLNEALEQIRLTLLKTHRGVEDFGFQTQEQFKEHIDEMILAECVGDGFIVAISMVVGAIGIANIMMASTSQRVREIGIRLAVGARSRDIFGQVLVESCILAILGAIVGVAASYIVISSLQKMGQFNYDLIIRWQHMAIGIGFSALAGFLAGFYPALRASRLNPIESLRFD
ncbi:MAG: ABC transporter permease [Verrucomicrobiae bacterium]|nr:ABC transporter permease [Verrucomicrobiae bacterium]